MKDDKQSRPPRRGRRRALGLIGGMLASPWIIDGAARAQAAWPID